MLANQTEYPLFVPDQLLTTDALNALFGYVEEQERLTRANLLGVGIVCGLEVQTAADGTSITISTGTGVTSMGYLAALTATTYTEYLPFNSSRAEYYEPFLNGDHGSKFALWELKETADVEGTLALSSSFITGEADGDEKIVLLFVELLDQANQNCNPESCDDMGVTVQVALRVLLARKVDVTGQLDQGTQSTGGLGRPPAFGDATFLGLSELRLKRFDVPATNVSSAAELWTAYQSIIAQLVVRLDDTLHAAYVTLKAFVATEFAADPFPQLAAKFAYVNDENIGAFELQHLQYIYDYLGDLMSAHAELRELGLRVLSTCCPDATSFPRHLLLGPASPPALSYPPLRHYFNASPIHGEPDLLGQLRLSFRRLAILANQFSIPAVEGNGESPDSHLRITPSRLAGSPLSARAIPYYLPPQLPATTPLYQNWSYARLRVNSSTSILSYNAGQYSSDDATLHPLEYDLEPYDFLRVEGHIGKSYVHVLRDLRAKITENRLPVDVIALALGSNASNVELLDASALGSIELQFQLLKSEITCCLGREISYFGQLEIKEKPKFVAGGQGLLSSVYASGTKVVGKAPSFSGRYAQSAFVIPDPVAPIAGQGPLVIGANSTTKTIANSATNEVAAPAIQIAAPAIKAAVARTMKAAAAPAMKAAVESDGRATLAPQASAASSAQGQYAKATLIQELVPEATAATIASEYAQYQANGNFSLQVVPTPTVAFGASVLRHYALVIVDELEELVLALGVDEALKLDLAGFNRHVDALNQALSTLSNLIAAYLDQQRPFAAIRAYVGEAHYDEIDAIADAMPVINASDANNILLSLLNQSASDTNDMIARLGQAQGNLADQRGTLSSYAGALDKDSMLVPSKKDLTPVDDPFLREVLDHIKGFGCLCGAGGLANLQTMLQKIIDELAPLALFANFAEKHPGLQHKAGVPLGGTLVLAYNQKGASSKEGTHYLNTASTLDDGVVVADFYLPYRCCSNSMPVVYQVNATEAATVTPTLTLTPNPDTGTLSYAVNDGRSYTFAATPAGGALSATIGGAATAWANTLVFRPVDAQALLGAADRVQIDFVYTLGTLTSAPLNVAVMQAPTVAIAAGSASIQRGDAVQITVTSVQRADEFSWRVRTSDGQTREIATTPDIAGYKPNESGSHAFSVLVTQSATRAQAQSNEVSVDVKDPVAPQKTCGNLPQLVGALQNLSKIDAENFPAFSKQVLDERGITPVLGDLGKVVTQSTETQIAYFVKTFGANAQLSTWTDALTTLIVGDAKQLRPLALETYRLIVGLGMYIACIQDADIDGAKLPLDKFFSTVANELVGSQSKGILQVFAQLDPTNEQLTVRQLTLDVKAERDRQTQNDALFQKPQYDKALTTLLQALTKAQ